MLKVKDLGEALDEIRDNKLSKLRQALQTDYSKQIFENVNKDEINLLKSYFDKLLSIDNLTIKKILTELNKYTISSDDEPLSDVVREIMDNISSKKISVDDFLTFMEDFNSQSFPIDIFYKKYMKKHYKNQVATLFGDDSSDDDSSRGDSSRSSRRSIRKSPSISSRRSSSSGSSRRSSSSSSGSSRGSSIRKSPSISSSGSRRRSSKRSSSSGSSRRSSSSSSSSGSSRRSSSSSSSSSSDGGKSMPLLIDDATEEEKLQRVRDKIKEKHVEQREVKLIDQTKLGKVMVVVDQNVKKQPTMVKNVTNKTFFENVVDLSKKDCEFLYKKIPWVKDIINNIYVHPIEGNFDNVVDFNSFIEYDGKKFYQPKEKYYYIQCHSNKVQKGHELTILKDGEIFKLMVAINTNTKGIVLQNEDMLKAEIDYIRVWNQNKDENIKELLRNKPSETMVLLAKIELSSTLQKAISNAPLEYRSNNSEFIETVVKTIYNNSNTGESFTRLLTNLIIFLNINLSFITSSVFIKRLREQIYLPGTLPFLTDADKLPEIFMVKNVPENTKAFVLEKLEQERSRFTKNFLENIYISSSTIRRPTRPILWQKPTMQIELPDIKSICKNKEQIEDEKDEDIVFYTDLDEVYCFNVYKLYDLFSSSEIPTNPYTNQPFSDKFVQMFLTRYASKPLVKKIEHTQRMDLTTRLEKLIEQELSLIENSLIETENPNFIERFKAKKEDSCFECKKRLEEGKKVSSIFRNKQVHFCGYDCLGKNKSFK
jgi:hypothetical protein